MQPSTRLMSSSKRLSIRMSFVIYGIMIRYSFPFHILSALQSLTDRAHPSSEQDDLSAREFLSFARIGSSATFRHIILFCESFVSHRLLTSAFRLLPAFFIFRLSSSNLHSFVVVSNSSHAVIMKKLSHPLPFCLIQPDTPPSYLLQCSLVHPYQTLSETINNEFDVSIFQTPPA